MNLLMSDQIYIFFLKISLRLKTILAFAAIKKSITRIYWIMDFRP